MLSRSFLRTVSAALVFAATASSTTFTLSEETSDCNIDVHDACGCSDVGQLSTVNCEDLHDATYKVDLCGGTASVKFFSGGRAPYAGFDKPNCGLGCVLDGQANGATCSVSC